MTNFSVTRNIPDGPNDPSDDQPNMKTNTNSMIDIWDVDHLGFGLTNGGYHTIIHQDTPATRTRSGAGAVTANFPAAIANINQLFSAFYTPDTTGGTADTQLFNLTGSNGLAQLTGSSFGSATDGWAWSNGVLFQWGKINTVLAVGTVTFKDRVPGAIPFPNACFNVQLTVISAFDSNTVVIDSGVLPTTTGFGYKSSGTVTAKIFWYAIGH